MKPIKNLLSGLLIIGGFIVALNFLHAQDTTSTTDTTSVTDTNIDWNSMSDAEVELLALEQTTPIPASQLPDAGTFWSAQHSPVSPEPWPPLPIGFLNVSAWPLGGNVFILDDLDYRYGTAQTQSQTMADGIHAMDGGGFTPDFTTPTNGLWLQITGVSNGLAYLTLNGTTNDVEYEILSEPSLTNSIPISAWNSEGMFWGSAVTNWTTMTIAQNDRTNLFFDALSWQDSTGTGIPDWWWLEYFGQDTNVDPYADPEGDGWDYLQKFQLGLNPTNFDTPPTPTGVYAYVDSTGTNVLISWNPSSGSVQDYIVGEEVYDPDTYEWNYEQVAEVGSDTTSFEDVGAFDPDDYNDYENYYVVQADYAGGVSPISDYASINFGPPSQSAFNANAYIAAYLVRNGTGRWQIMFSGFPTNSTQTIQLTWTDTNYVATLQNISTTNLINGVYQISDADVVNDLGDSLSVQLLGPDGEPGQVAQAGVLPNGRGD
ncbi:MAG: hypothetical protein ACREC8_01020 [Limisphaerales bacterium]